MLTAAATRSATRSHIAVVSLTLEQPNGAQSTYMKQGDLWFVWREVLWDGADHCQAWCLIESPSLMADLDRRAHSLLD